MQSEPVGIAALVAGTGLHGNTVREHLDGLRANGLVRRAAAPASGRGRPGWLYESTPKSSEDPRPEYAALAVALVDVIAATRPAPAEDARRAGVEWGRRLGALQRPQGTDELAAHRAVVEIFDKMGFAPETNEQARTLRLTRCPLLAAATERPDVVCSVHLGIAEGALESYEVPIDGLELVPFAEPGACRLRLEAER